jgi:SAM-dependent methyltransferase
MTDARLQAHYDEKYRTEADGPEAQERIADVRVPTSRFEAIAKAFPKYFHGGDVLELGAGNGLIARTLLGSRLISKYTLSDVSRPRLEGVRASIDDPRVRIVELNAEEVRDDEGSKYDAIVMVALIEHLIDPLGAMTRLRQLLRPGGFVYIDTPNIAKYTQRLKLLSGRFPSTASADEGLIKFSGEPVDLYDEGHLHYFTFRSLSRMLTERCGYSRIEKVPYPGGRIPLGRFVHGRLAVAWPEMFSELALVAFA